MTARQEWVGPSVAAASLVLAALAGLVATTEAWALPFAAFVFAGVVAIGLAGEASLLAFVVVLAIIQPPIGSFGGYQNITLQEATVPILVVLVVWRCTGAAAAARARGTRAATLSSQNAIQIAVAAFTLMLVANVVRTRVGLDAPSATRPFYAYFVALGIFVLTYVTLTRRRVSLAQLFKHLYWVSLVVCLIGLAAIALNIPLDSGALRYSVYEWQTGAVRVGFLEVVGAAGLALVFAGRPPSRTLSGVVFAAAIIASGGRSAAAGIALGLLLFLLLRRRPWPLLAVGAASLGLFIAMPALEGLPQIERLTNVSETAIASDDRAFFYDEAFAAFRDNAVFGTGFGVMPTVFARTEDLRIFYEDQLAYGGHGTYHSLLKNFGLVGFLPFLAILIAGLGLTARETVRGNSAAGVFFILLVEQTVAMYAGGNGANIEFFFVLGGAAAVMRLRKARGV